MKIILLGYMGSGKTVVGRALSGTIGLPFLDLDEQISAKEEKSISEIFETKGEIYFRKREAEVLQDLMQLPEDFILALGGGTPCYGNNLALLKDQKEVILVYLKTSLQELLKRLSGEREQRPLISHLNSAELLEDFIRKHLFERTYYYNQSDLVISTDGKTSEVIAAEVLEKLN